MKDKFDLMKFFAKALVTTLVLFIMCMTPIVSNAKAPYGDGIEAKYYDQMLYEDNCIHAEPGDHWYKCKFPYASREWQYLLISDAEENPKEYTVDIYNESGKVLSINGQQPKYSNAVFVEGNSEHLYVHVVCQDNINILFQKNYDYISKEDNAFSNLSLNSTTHVSSTGLSDRKFFMVDIPKDLDVSEDSDGWKNMLKITKSSVKGNICLESAAIGRDFSGLIEGAGDWTDREVCYATISPGVKQAILFSGWDGAAEADISVKIVKVREEDYMPKYNGELDNIKLNEISKPLIESTRKFLQSEYVDRYPELGLRVMSVTKDDLEYLKKLAAKITAGAKTDREKADAISKWVTNNMKVRSGYGKQTIEALEVREGNCESFSNITSDLMKICGIRAVVCTGWVCDTSLFTVKSIKEIIGHAWLYAYIDGEWLLYDSMFSEYGINDVDYEAKHYFTTYADYVSMDCPQTKKMLTEEGIYLVDGKYKYYIAGVPASKVGKYMVDKDGHREQITYCAYDQYSLSVDTQFICFPIAREYGNFYRKSIDGEESDKPALLEGGDCFEAGINQDSCITMENGRAYGNCFYYENGKTYYVDGAGYPNEFNTDEYWLSEGMLAVPKSASGRIMYNTAVAEGLRHPEGKKFYFESLTPDTAEVDDKGNVKIKKCGEVTIYAGVGPDDDNYGYSVIGPVTYLVEEHKHILTLDDSPVEKEPSGYIDDPTNHSAHTFGVWETINHPSVFDKGNAMRRCSVCGKCEFKDLNKIPPTIKLSVTKKTIKVKKSFTLKISKLVNMDSVASVKSSKKSVAKVKKISKNKYKITGKKKGSATITVKLASGKKATCKVKVKK